MRNQILSRAIYLAVTKSDDRLYKHAAILFDKRYNIISEGWNLSRSVFEPARMFGYKYPTIHAEFMCLTRVPSDWVRGKNLLVIRLNKRGDLMNSMPCAECARLINKFGIKHLIYSTNAGTLKKIREYR